MRCMQSALGRITSEEPRYSELMQKTLAALAQEGIVPSGDEQHYHNLFYRLYSDRSLRPIAVNLTEGFVQLCALGYIVPQPAHPNAPNPNWFCITETGKAWASGATPPPEDPQGYLAALDALVPAVDPVVKQYVQEAVVTYERRAWFASAVMIGAASEKTVYLLMDALLLSVQDAGEKNAIKNTMIERSLPKMFRRLSDNLNRAISTKAMPYAIHEGADKYLAALQEAIRTQRNDAVHPQAGQVMPETVQLTLAIFPLACKKAYDLKEWFESNQLI